MPEIHARLVTVPPRGLAAPTLRIVGGQDFQLIERNSDALRRNSAPARLVLVPGATHLFEEPGALDRVVRLATAWFDEHLATPADGARHGGQSSASDGSSDIAGS